MYITYDFGKPPVMIVQEKFWQQNSDQYKTGEPFSKFVQKFNNRNNIPQLQNILTEKSEFLLKIIPYVGNIEEFIHFSIISVWDNQKNLLVNTWSAMSANAIDNEKIYDFFVEARMIDIFYGLWHKYEFRYKH